MDSEKATEGSSVIARMRLLILSAFALVVGLLFSTTTPAFANAPIAASEGCSVPGKGTLLRVRMEFDFGDLNGQEPTSAQKENLINDVEEFEKRTERAFNESGYKNADGSRIILDIDARSVYDLVGNAGPNTHLVYLHGNANHRDTVDQVGEMNSDNSTVGDWRRATINDPFETDQALHEMGHQMGLDDAYKDYVTDGAGRRSVPKPEGMQTDLNGNIFNPQHWQRWARRHDLDPDSIRIRSRENSGHNGDIMAGYDRQRRFRNRDLRRLLRGAPRCRDEDNELFDKADQQPDFDTRGPKSPRTCYVDGKKPLSGETYWRSAGRGFVPYQYDFDLSDPSIRLLRYAQYDIGERVALKIACRWQDEVEYVQQLLKLSQKLQDEQSKNERRARSETCDRLLQLSDRVNQTEHDGAAVLREASRRETIFLELTRIRRLPRQSRLGEKGYRLGRSVFFRIRKNLLKQIQSAFHSNGDVGSSVDKIIHDRQEQCHTDGFY